MIDDEFNRSKSNIKWLEYSLKGIPTVASNVEPYKCIENDKTGYLCDKPEDWYETLSMLIKSPQKRKNVAESASTEVKNNWDYRGKGKLWKDAFNGVLKSK